MSKRRIPRFQYYRRNVARQGKPSLRQLSGVVSPRILRALRASAEQMDKIGVRYVLIGGLAIGAYGYPRATKDVDFLVGDEAFKEHSGGLITFVPGLPIQWGDVPVDPLSIGDDEFLESALEEYPEAEGIAIAPIEVLIYLKLKSNRNKDFADVVELIKARGGEIGKTEKFIEENAPEYMNKLRSALSAAGEE